VGLSVASLAIALPTLFVTTQAPAAAATFVVGVTYSTLQTPYFQSIEANADKVAKADNIQVISLSANNDAQTQVTQMDEFIARKVNLILLNPVDTASNIPTVKAAKKAGIPVITFDRPMFTQESQGYILTHIGASAQQGGFLEMQYVCDQFPGHLKVMGLWGTPGVSTSNERTAGAEQALKTAACHGAKVIGQQYVQAESQQQSYTDTQDWIQRYPAGAFNAIVTYADDMAEGVIQALHAADRTGVLVTGAANFGPFAQAICGSNRNPEAAATVNFATNDEGALMMQTADKALTGENKFVQWIQVPATLVDSQNCKQFPPAA
jgi:ABC-type sugar transport system substrate-binding protein